MPAYQIGWHKEVGCLVVGCRFFSSGDICASIEPVIRQCIAYLFAMQKIVGNLMRDGEPLPRIGISGINIDVVAAEIQPAQITFDLARHA